ncbi:MAG: family 78 glycoside hydrolase catalytic domain [Thermoguttaceae bacterium]|nr:family 78 glycoside hydrolase catalytic domain [Thermoguttaceae bacterium]
MTHAINRRSFLKSGTLAGAAAMCGLPEFELRALEAESAQAPKFQKAVPLWEKGREEEMNVTLVFFAAFKIDEDAIEGAILRSTGSSMMRIMIDGKYFGYGPARGPHGWFRVDEWDLSKRLTKGTHFLTIEVAGYNSNSFYLLDQPSFLQAEVVDGNGKVLAATLENGEEGIVSIQAIDYTGIRVQKVQRFSFQRPFIEVYNIGKIHEMEKVDLAKQPEVNYLPRRVPYPEFAVIEPIGWGKTGKVAKREKLENPWRDRSLVNIGPELKGYKMDELEIVLSDEVQALETTFDENAKPLEIGATYNEGDFQIIDFGANYCGFLGLEVKTKGKTEIVLTFDEILNPAGDLNFLRLGTCSAIKWTVDNDSFALPLEAFEPQVGRYAKLHCLKGSFTLNKVYTREFAYPPTRESSFDCADPRLVKLYKAADLTFRENSVDVFTDCPHRERAGWLCDSFFTARSAFDLTGKTDVEDAFFENYMLPESFKCLPDGMLPMCYPSDHYDGVYIPNWAMWFVAELREYARRTPDHSVVKGLRKKIEKLMAFFEKYENSDGLLEKLPSWVFVEWSRANDFVQDVNYPSNMLYAFILNAAGELYDVPQWTEKAEKIRATIREQSYDGEFFVDHAVRKEDGSLEIMRDRSEVCQYFAFFFKTATPETYPELWAKLLDEFGPNRIKEGVYPEIYKANSFVGNVLRLDLLAQANRGSQLLAESVAYNEYMADRTGTLWENDEDYASCNHGFASHLVHILYRDVLGVADVDAAAKKIVIRIPKIDGLDWASGVQPVPGGAIKLRWEKKADGEIAHTLEAPDGYEVVVE